MAPRRIPTTYVCPLIISPTHNLIFVAIPKTGSTSVENAFSRILPEGEVFSGWGTNLPRDEQLKHLMAMQIRERLGDHEFRSFHRFAVIRNPYSLAVSWYKYLKGVTDFYLGQGVPVNHPWNDISATPSFEKFILETDKWITVQSQYIFDSDGNYLLDRLLRQECLEQDLALMAGELGIRGLVLDRDNKSLYDDGRSYQSFYTSPTVQRAVATALAEDFARLGFNVEL